MKNINHLLEQFLDVQKSRLKKRTYDDYEGTIHLFKTFLNQYGYQHLEGSAETLWETQIDNDPEFFTNLFGADQITLSTFDEFIDYFVRHKVMSGKDFFKVTVRVMKKLSTWLYNENHMDQATYATFQTYFQEDVKEIEQLEKLSDLIYDEQKKSPQVDYENYLEGYLTITAIKPKQLWVSNSFEKDIGPICVSKEISDLCQLDWSMNVVIGQHNGKWYILESGNVSRDY